MHFARLFARSFAHSHVTISIGDFRSRSKSHPLASTGAGEGGRGEGGGKPGEARLRAFVRARARFSISIHARYSLGPFEGPSPQFGDLISRDFARARDRVLVQHKDGHLTFAGREKGGSSVTVIRSRLAPSKVPRALSDTRRLCSCFFPRSSDY